MSSPGREDTSSESDDETQVVGIDLGIRAPSVAMVADTDHAHWKRRSVRARHR